MQSAPLYTKKTKLKLLVFRLKWYYLEIDDEKKYLFGKDGAKNLANEIKIKFLGEIPILEEFSEKGLIIEENSEISSIFDKITNF